MRAPEDHFFRRLLCALLFVAVALSLAMSLLSTMNKPVHHDEFDHFNAARYYSKHWLPPAVGDPRVNESNSIYGMSYLHEWDIVYAIAGKFATLIEPLTGDFGLSLRLFNVALLLILSCIAAFASSAVLGIAVLVTSPQIWYTFSYFNGDSFPLFICFVIVAILGTPDARANKSRRALARCLLVGICIGLLVISKKSFWIFGLFSVCVVFLLEFHRFRREHDLRALLRNLGLFFVMIVGVASPRVAFDFYLNGHPAQKQARILAVAEEQAAPLFKPSTSSKWSLNLRGKGVSLMATMKPPLNWPIHTFRTMFGAYNYNMIRADVRIYNAFLVGYALFLIYLVGVIAIRGDGVERAILCVMIVAIVLIVGLAAYHAWTADFQPQGRYLFAMFAMVAVVLTRNRLLLRATLAYAFLIVAFLLSAYSFMSVGLTRVPQYRDLEEISPKEFIRPRSVSSLSKFTRQ